MPVKSRKILIVLLLLSLQLLLQLLMTAQLARSIYVLRLGGVLWGERAHHLLERKLCLFFPALVDENLRVNPMTVRKLTDLVNLLIARVVWLFKLALVSRSQVE